MAGWFSDINKSKLVLWLWGAFDALYVALYTISSVRAGRLPYFTDLMSTVDNLVSHGGIIIGVMIGFSWLLQISIIISAILLLLNSRKAKLLCYIQTPFRVVFMVPSVSIITYLLGVFDIDGLVIFAVLLLLSESIKIYSLWRFS